MIYITNRRNQNDFLIHHGILGQKWGRRNGPPYPLSGGDYSEEEKKHLRPEFGKDNSRYNKKHYDKTIDKGTILTTLSRDPGRLKNTEMYYATYKRLDKHQYNALFNKRVEEPILDEDGNQIGTGMFLKYKIDSKALKDIKVASEDAGIETFANLYKNNRDFYNFVTDETRMQKAFVDDKYVFKGYREARKSLENIRDLEKKPSYEDISRAYRMFNYVLPYMTDNIRLSNDVRAQRAKFFSELMKHGYGAVLDTNDALYGAYKATAPVIVFDMKSVAVSNVSRTTIGSKAFSELVTTGRKALGL